MEAKSTDANNGIMTLRIKSDVCAMTIDEGAVLGIRASPNTEVAIAQRQHHF
jgi:hypothetical protein